MTDGSWDTKGHCTAFRTSRNLATGATSDCWKTHYDALSSNVKPTFNSAYVTE